MSWVTFCELHEAEAEIFSSDSSVDPGELYVCVTLPHLIFLAPWSEIKWPHMCGPISGWSILFPRLICLHSCHFHTVLIIVLLKLILKSGFIGFLPLFCLSKIVLIILDNLHFYIIVRISCHFSQKSLLGFWLK